MGINFDESMDKYLHLLQIVGWNHLSIPKLQQLHHWSLKIDKYFYSILYIMDVIAYPCWDYS